MYGEDQALTRVFLTNLTERDVWFNAGTVLAIAEHLETGDPVDGEAYTEREPLDFLEFISPTLPTETRKLFEETLRAHKRTFTTETSALGVCKLTRHVIDTGSAKLQRQGPFSSSWKERENIHEQVQQIINVGVVEK